MGYTCTHMRPKPKSNLRALLQSPSSHPFSVVQTTWFSLCFLCVHDMSDVTCRIPLPWVECPENPVFRGESTSSVSCPEPVRKPEKGIPKGGGALASHGTLMRMMRMIVHVYAVPIELYTTVWLASGHTWDSQGQILSKFKTCQPKS